MEFRTLKNFENYYIISNTGIIKSVDRYVNCGIKYNNKVLKKGKEIKPIIVKGYYNVSLSKNGKSKQYSIHRLVAQTFIPNPNNLPQVNHIDGNKLNNCVSNLEWCTAKHNINESYRIGLHSKKSIMNSINAMNKKTRKKIVQIKNNNIIKIYESLTQAEKNTNIKIDNISACLNNRSKTAGGYIWKYESEVNYEK